MSEERERVSRTGSSFAKQPQSPAVSIRFSRAFAAICSACRLEPAVASAPVPSSSRRAMVKTARDRGRSARSRRSAAAAGPAPGPIPEARSWRRGHLPRPCAIRSPQSRSTMALAASKPGIEIDGGDHRLHRVAQQRHLAPPAREHFRPAELQRRAQVDLARDIGAGFLAHQRVEARRKLAFGGRAIIAESSASAITRPSTRSPRNSSRWLSSRLGRTSRDGSRARRISSGRVKSWPRRCCKRLEIGR